VTGVDPTDFTLTNTGAVTGAAVTSVTGSGTTYFVTVNTGSGDGTIKLNLIDNDSIASYLGAHLGGLGAGNGNFTTGPAYTIDKTPPAAPSVPALAPASDSGISNSDDITNITAPSFTGTAEAGSTVTIYSDGTAVGSGLATGGNYAITVSALANGSHNITAVATDVAGNTGPASAPLVVTIDSVAPATSLTSQPPAFSNSTTAVFGFAATDNFSSLANLIFQVSLDGSAFTGAATPLTYTGLAAGSHTFQVRSEDQAGNFSSAASYTWTIDTTPPTATITAKPPALTNSTSASFSFNGSDNVTPAASLVFQVSLDGSAFATATSPTSYTGLAAGNHTFKVEAVDQAGNIGAPASYTWTIDRTPPTAAITAKPPLVTNSTSASFSFTGSDNITPLASLVFQTALDGGAFVTASSPVSYTGLALGSHTFRVRDIDRAGNVGTPASYVWTIVSTQPGYSVTDLGTLGGTTSYARAINAVDQVTGYAATSSGQYRAFLWSGGVMTNLGTLGGSASYGMGINDAGQVVGYSTTAASLTHAFLYSGGTMTDLGTLGGSYSYAFGINNAGQVVGYSSNASGQYHAFVYSAGVMSDLGTLGGTSSYALAINASGQVAGYSTTTAGQTHAFRSSGGVMTDLGTLGGTSSVGYDINVSGQVAGYSTTAAGQNRAFVTSGSTLTNLGTLGGTYSIGYGLNDAGQVVGYASNPTGTYRPFLASGGANYDLTTLVPAGSALTPSYVYALNNTGRIAGYGRTSGGQYHALLLTPDTASFQTLDTTTQGTWKSKYGASGYSIFQDSASIPSYASVSVSGASGLVWNNSTVDLRALQKGAAGSTDRIAAADSSATSFTIDINFSDGKVHEVAAYALDWDGSNSRSERIDIIDPVTHRVLSSQTVSAFSNGDYLLWDLSGHVQIQVTNLSGASVVLSGIFFDS
jgi:probable HAF family extracellular repeat protein